MAKCRIQNLKPPCDYSVEGLTDIRLLDFDDALGFKFSGGNLYDNCLVTAVLRAAPFTEVETPDGAKYSSTQENKIYTHTLETFVAALAADVASNLHLGTKRRYVPFFTLKNGKYFTFGSDAGAVLTYTNQTAESAGALITLKARSIYPLFEVTAEAMVASIAPSEYKVDFINGAFCQTI